MSILRSLLESPGLKKLTQREQLKELIMQINQMNGGDDPAFLQARINEILTDWDNRLDDAIACYKNVLSQYTKLRT